jgi:hypothetical protein
MINPTKSASKIILTVLVCILLSFNLVNGVSAQSTVVKAEASTSQPQVGDTLTVNIIISNVQNLFGVDVTLTWNPSVLSIVSATSQLGVESHPGGVLHETSSYPIEVVDDTASQSTGQYHLLSTSTGSATPFSGSGTIATLTFRVTNLGSAGLTSISELSDHPAAGGNANLIVHTDTADSVTAVTSGASITPTPTRTHFSFTPQPSASIPEFSNAALIIILIIVISATIATISTKILKNRSILSTQNATNF